MQDTVSHLPDVENTEIVPRKLNNSFQILPAANRHATEFGIDHVYPLVRTLGFNTLIDIAKSYFCQTGWLITTSLKTLAFWYVISSVKMVYFKSG